MAERTVSVKLQAEVATYIAKMQQAAVATRAVGAEVTEAARKGNPALQSIGRGAVVTGAAVAAGLGVAISKFANFDAAMAGVRAASHETAGNMDRLRAAALKAGADTAFSATEAAGAIEELSKAGLSTKNILSGGLKGALDLAAAGGLEVGEAAEYAATTMTQFGLAGKDIPRIADLMAAAAGKAQGEVADMALAMKYAGVPAAELGVSVEQTAGTIALFAKNGIIGEQAGTSLRSMIASLTAPSAQAAATMKELGLRVFDAQGNFVGLDGVAGQLNERLAGATQAQRSMALGVIFGNESLQAANVLTREGAAGVAEWTRKVDDQGYAATTAATKMDSLRGDVEALAGSLETALIGAGSSANGVLREMAQVATGALNAYSALPKGAQDAATGLTALGGAASLAAGAFFLGAPKVVAFREALATMGPNAQRAGRALSVAGGVVAGPWGLALAGGVVALGGLAAAHAEAQARVDGLTEAIKADTGALGENTRAAVVNQLQKSGVLKAAREMGVALGEVTEAALGDAAAMRRVNEALDDYVARQGGAVLGATKGGVALTEAGKGADELRRSLSGTNDELAEAQENFSLTKEAMAGLRDKRVTLTIDGARAAAAEVAALRYQIDRVPTAVTVGVINKVSRQPLATGGYVTGPGTATSDSIPAWLSDGEYVVRAAAVARYGTAFFDAANAMRLAAGGEVRGFAAPPAMMMAPAPPPVYFTAPPGPSTLVVVDADGQLVGRMRVEAGGAVSAAMGGLANSLTYGRA